MTWLGVAGIAVVAALLIALARANRSSRAESGDDVDPLFSTGVVITGTGAVLGSTIGPVMYSVMAVGLAAMALGAHRSRQHRHNPRGH